VREVWRCCERPLLPHLFTLVPDLLHLLLAPGAASALPQTAIGKNWEIEKSHSNSVAAGGYPPAETAGAVATGVRRRRRRNGSVNEAARGSRAWATQQRNRVAAASANDAARARRLAARVSAAAEAREAAAAVADQGEGGGGAGRAVTRRGRRRRRPAGVLGWKRQAAHTARLQRVAWEPDGAAARLATARRLGVQQRGACLPPQEQGAARGRLPTCRPGVGATFRCSWAARWCPSTYFLPYLA